MKIRLMQDFPLTKDETKGKWGHPQRGGGSFPMANPMSLLVRNIEMAFGKLPEPNYKKYSEDLNFSAPGVVPGFTDETVGIEGAELGDTVLVAVSIDIPAGFMPPVGFVSAAGTITIRWLQVTGSAADPDGSGATYTIDLWRH